MPFLRCLCCLFSCPDGCVHHYSNKLDLDDFEYFFSTGPELFFLAQPKASNVELRSPTNMTFLERLLMVSNNLRFGFPFGQ